MADAPRSPISADTPRSLDPLDVPRSLDPLDVPRSLDPLDVPRSLDPLDVPRSLIPTADATRSLRSTMHPKGCFVLVTGPMFSGKTRSCIVLTDTEACIPGTIVLYIRPECDARAGQRGIIAHSGDEIRPEHVIVAKKLVDVDARKIEEAHVIFIDEGQWFEDLDHAASWAARGKRVFVAALNGDRDRKPWPNVVKIMGLVTNIVFQHGICRRCGKKSCYSHDKIGDDDSEVVVGGEERYEGLCLHCYEYAILPHTI